MNALAGAFAFGISLLVVGAGAVFLSGMFPAAARPAPMQTTTAGVLVGLAVLATGAHAAAALIAAVGQIPAAWLIISGGLGVLFGPIAFQVLPRSWADTPDGAASFVTAGIAGALAWTLLP